MTKSEAIAWAGTQVKLAELLGISQGTVAGWVGESPPELRQLQIERLSGGALRAGPECEQFRVPLIQAA